MFKIYLDTTILSRLTDYQKGGESLLGQADLDGLEILLRRQDIHLVTSEKALQEFSATESQPQRIALELYYRLMAKVDSVPTMHPRAQIMVASSRSRFIESSVVNDPLYDKLLRVFDPADAVHIFQAVKGDCDYFLTTDHKTILHRVRERHPEIKPMVGRLRFGRPSQVGGDLPAE
jgi:predicted nucleic acid-binding protein